MSLRARLTVAFVAVLALPLFAVVLLHRGALTREVRERAAAELSAAQAAAPSIYRSAQTRAADLVKDAAGRLGGRRLGETFGDRDVAARFAADGRGALDLLAVVGRDGTVLGVSATPPQLLPGAIPRPVEDVVRDRLASGAALAEAVVAGDGGSPGSLVGGFWLDSSFLDSLGSLRSRALLVVDGVAVASTDPSVRTAVRPSWRQEGSLLEGRIDGREVVAVAGPMVDGVPVERLAVVAFQDRASALDAGTFTTAAVAILLVAILAGALVAWIVARALTRPLDEMASAAHEIARGGAAATIDTGTDDEVGRLGAAFNEVLGAMQSRVLELEESRDEARRFVGRLGEALRSTHDLGKLLSVVLETAVAAVHARAGGIWLIAPSRVELSLKVARGIDLGALDRRMRVGEGIAGAVAQERRAVLLPSAVEAPPPAAWEPHEPTVIAVPVESETQLLGVIALYGRTLPRPFDSLDLETVRSLARQAAVGVENVLLHQEAQRLSITDGLTSLWNYRYLNMRLAQEVERAIRFNRAMSLLVIDIDDFKAINDRYGHQRGDAILAELANRIVTETRAQVDTVARYGGEEFVLLLPETPLAGGLVVAEKIREEIATRPFGSEGEAISVTVSIGLSCFPQHGSTATTLLRAADQAMYEAKGRGRNRVVTADELDTAPPHAGADDTVADEPGHPYTHPPDLGV